MPSTRINRLPPRARPTAAILLNVRGFRGPGAVAFTALAALLLAAVSSHAGWYRHTVVQGYSGTRAVYAADMDGDGDIDVCGAARYDNLIGWWENLGLGNWAEHILSTEFSGAWDVNAGDMDGDGDLDLLGAAMTGGEVAWWRNGPEPWPKQQVGDSFPYSKGVFAADFNNDGRNDIVACSYSLDRMSWAENTPEGWVEHILDSNFYGARAVSAADIDRDGDMDILGAADSAGISCWENRGGPWLRHPMPETIWGARSVHAADIVGDSTLEILAASSWYDLICYWRLAGNEWEITVVADDFVFANDIYSGDMDGDGDLDIVGGGYESNRVTWWENVDRNGSWIEHDVSRDADGTRSVFVADVDGDGDNDILAACAHQQLISWWENETAVPLSYDAVPAEDPAVVPDSGGLIAFNDHFISILNAPLHDCLWKDLRDRDHELVLSVQDSVVVFPGAGALADSFLVPGEIAAGEYRLVLSVGFSRDSALAVDSLAVVKELAESRPEDSGYSPPGGFTVSRAFPNPFNATASFTVELPAPSRLRVTVSDILGRRAALLADGEVPPGVHRFRFSGQDRAAGIYFLCVSVSGRRDQVQKIVLLK